MNLGGRYQLQKHVELFAQVNNLLNHRYYTAAQLGATGFTAQGTFLARPFPAVGGEFPLVIRNFSGSRRSHRSVGRYTGRLLTPESACLTEGVHPNHLRLSVFICGQYS